MMKHGTVNGYSNYKCRCPECKKAWNDYQKEYKRKKYNLPVQTPQIVYDTESGMPPDIDMATFFYSQDKPETPPEIAEYFKKLLEEE